MKHFRFPVIAVAFTGILASLVFAVTTSKLINLEDQKKFKELVDNIERPVDSRMKRYEVGLSSTRAFISTRENPTLDELENYVRATELLENFPGAQGLGYTIRLDRRSLGKTGEFSFMGKRFVLWPLEPAREDYFSIVFLYPMDWRNQRAVGFDMFSEPTRQDAMARAWETGEAALTAKVTLVQETDKDTQPGFLLYLPFYKPGAATETVDQRRKALVGFVYAPFRSKDFMESIVPSGTANVDYQLYSNSIAPENLLYDNKTANEVDARFQEVREIYLGGQKFILTVQALKGFTSVFRSLLSWIILLVGLTFTALLAFTISRLRIAAEKDRDAKETLETLNRIVGRVSAELDLDRLAQEITDAATQVCRAQFGALFYNVISAEGEALTLYALSGAPREAFSKFPLPRNTKVFNPTFTNEGVVRSADITKDPRYGKNAPYKGMPEGHLPVRSYLAVSVVSRSGEVLGGLFFGHKEIGVFTERDEKLMVAFANQAAIAIDNANLYKRAQEAIRARDEFLSVCSHELKTPLTSLQLEAQINERLLKKQGDQAATADRFKEMIETTKKQTQNLTSLVDDMLDVGRISTGRLVLRPNIIDVHEVIDESVRAVKPQFDAQGVSLEVLVSNERIEVNWDKLRVSQIVTNLLMNALKYGEKKPVLLKAEVVMPNMLISVLDSGKGVPADFHEKIFHRFERANLDKNVSGLGLGLFISRKIAEAHDGSVRVDTMSNGGSRFTATIPLFPAFLISKTEAEHVNERLNQI